MGTLPVLHGKHCENVPQTDLTHKASVIEAILQRRRLLLSPASLACALAMQAAR